MQISFLQMRGRNVIYWRWHSNHFGGLYLKQVKTLSACLFPLFLSEAAVAILPHAAIGVLLEALHLVQSTEYNKYY
jgi:hypothetical protein